MPAILTGSDIEIADVLPRRHEKVARGIANDIPRTRDGANKARTIHVRVAPVAKKRLNAPLSGCSLPIPRLVLPIASQIRQIRGLRWWLDYGDAVVEAVCAEQVAILVDC